MFCINRHIHRRSIPTLLELQVRVFAKLRKAPISLVMSVRLSVHQSACNNSAPPGRIFMKFAIWVFLETQSRRFHFDYNLERITGILHEGLCAVMTVSRQFLLRMRNSLDKSCIKSINFTFNKFSPEPCRLWDNVENVVQPDRPPMAL